MWLLRPAPIFHKNLKKEKKQTLKRPEKIYIYIKRKSVVTFSCASKVQFNKICNVHTRKMTDSDPLPHTLTFTSLPQKCHSDLSD